MYSRNGEPRPPVSRGLGSDRAPSYRQRRRVEVPPGYSGHAIIDGEERPLGDGVVMEERPGSGSSLPELPREPVPEPRFDGLPRVSEAGMAARGRREVELTEGEPADATLVPPAAPRATEADAVSLFDAGHFPFGHGLGFEEILLLGLMWLLLHEARESGERGDLEETLLMLGALLLAG